MATVRSTDDTSRAASKCDGAAARFCCTEQMASERNAQKRQPGPEDGAAFAAAGPSPFATANRTMAVTRSAIPQPRVAVRRSPKNTTPPRKEKSWADCMMPQTRPFGPFCIPIAIAWRAPKLRAPPRA